MTTLQLTNVKHSLQVGDALVFTCGSLRSIVRFTSLHGAAWMRVDEETYLRPLAFGVAISCEMYAICLRGVILPGEIIVDVTVPQSVEVCKAGVPTCQLVRAKVPAAPVGLN